MAWCPMHSRLTLPASAVVAVASICLISISTCASLRSQICSRALQQQQLGQSLLATCETGSLQSTWLSAQPLSQLHQLISECDRV